MNFKLYNVDYLKHLCQKYGLRPSKNYGQNYLINDDVIDTMLACAALTSKDIVVEVGPGFGVLTQELVEKVKQVYAFEIEKKLVSYWEEKMKNEKITNLEMIWGNILYQENNEVWTKMKSYKVVANLPYQITSPAIMFFLEKAPVKPKEIFFMVQKEVAQRLCSEPGDMSVLSIITQYFCEARILGAVKRNNFWPEPKVDSAIISLKPIKPVLSAKVQEFMFKLLKIGFAQRRKLLIKNILPLLGKDNKAEVLETFAKYQINAAARPQDLSVAQWVQLSTYWIDKIVV